MKKNKPSGAQNRKRKLEKEATALENSQDIRNFGIIGKRVNHY